jgi:hypothetical protein
MRLRHACILLHTRCFVSGKDGRALTPDQDPQPSIHVEDLHGGNFAQTTGAEHSIRPGHYQS